MANIYVRSTTGSDANSGADWANAKATIQGAAAIDAAGDTIFISQVHAEASSTNQSANLAGTESNPVRIICGNDAATPPTAVATTGTIGTVNGSLITVSGSAYVYGVKFSMGTGANNPSLQFNSRSNTEFELCQFIIPATGASAFLQMGNNGGSPGTKIWTNCDVKFANAAQVIKLFDTSFQWRGGSVLSGSTALTGALFAAFASTVPTTVLVEDVDFSNLGTSAKFISSTIDPHQTYTMRNCKLPASWSGTLVNGSFSFVGCRASMYNCDSGATTYKVNIVDYAGTINDETTNTRTGGAYNGTTAMSWKMVTNATPVLGAKFGSLISDEIVIWNDTVGAAKTVTVEVLHDSVTNLKNNEIWLEVDYLGASSSPLATHISDWPADPLATAADQTTSSASWTTTGLTNPNKQKLDVTFTPQTKGFIHARVYINKPSYTVFVDPAMTVT
jgi:hypothetical protein